MIVGARGGRVVDTNNDGTEAGTAGTGAKEVVALAVIVALAFVLVVADRGKPARACLTVVGGGGGGGDSWFVNTLLFVAGCEVGGLVATADGLVVVTVVVVVLLVVVACTVVCVCVWV